MADAVTGEGRGGRLKQIVADLRELARETSGLFSQLKMSTDISRRAIALLASGGVVVLIATIFLCLTIVHVLAWALPDQPVWYWYGAVAVATALIGAVLVAVGRRELKGFTPVQKQSAVVVQDAKETAEHVGDVIRTARHSVQHAADSVRDAVNVKQQFDKRPWMIMAGAAAAGFLGGKVLNANGAPDPAPSPRRTGKSGTAKRPRRVRRMATKFEPEIAHIKALALGTLLGIVRDVATKSAPPRLEHEISDVIDGITEKIGGTPSEKQKPSATNDPMPPLR